MVIKEDVATEVTNATPPGGVAIQDDEEDKELQAAIKASELQVLAFVLEAAARAATVARTAVNPSAPALAV
jgi:hypothetical protein